MKQKSSAPKKLKYIPLRYSLAILLALAETLAIVVGVMALCVYVPYFYILVALTQIWCVLRVINSDDNPDYKAPWLLVILVLPIAGFMLYFIFYSRKLSRRQSKRLRQIAKQVIKYDNNAAFDALSADSLAAGQASFLVASTGTHVYTNCTTTYFSSGEDMFKSMVEDLQKAKKFIFIEYLLSKKANFGTQF